MLNSNPKFCIVLTSSNVILLYAPVRNLITSKQYSCNSSSGSNSSTNTPHAKQLAFVFSVAEHTTKLTATAAAAAVAQLTSKHWRRKS
jgi:hypothetical protein